MSNKRIIKSLLTVILLTLVCVGFFACKKPVIDTETVVAGISVSAVPKQYYEVGEAINLDGGMLNVTYSDGKTGQVAFGDANVKVSHYGTNIDGRIENMTVEYAGKSVKVPYCTSSTVKSVSVDWGTMCSRYSVGAKIDYGTAKFIVNLKNGSTATYRLSLDATRENYNYEANGFNTTIAVEKATAKFNFYVTEFSFDYMVAAEKFTLANLLNKTPQTLYMLGEEIDLTGVQIASSVSDGTSILTDVTAEMISGFDTSVTGKRKLTISWNGFGTVNDTPYSEEIEYTVYDENAIEGIVIEVYAGEVNYYVNEALKLEKTAIIIDFGENVKKSVPFTDTAVTLKDGTFSTSLGGEFSLTLVYTTPAGTEYEASTSYFVTRRVSSIEVKDVNLIVKEYTTGDPFDFGEAYALVHWDDGTQTRADLADQFELMEGWLIGIYTRPTPSSYQRLTPFNIDMSTIGEHVFYIGYAGRDVAEIRYEIYPR